MAAVEAQAAGTPVLVSDAVPAEACVIPDLYNQLSLEDPLNIWAEVLVDIFRLPRFSFAEASHHFLSSPFSIVHSARRLQSLYSGEK